MMFVCVVGCASPGEVREYVRTPVASAPLPAAPIAWCEAKPQLTNGELWLVFISDPCPACRRMLRWLEARGESAALVVLYEESCARARGALRGRTFTFAAGSSELAAAWYVESTPTAYRIRDGVVVERLIGVPE